MTVQQILEDPTDLTMVEANFMKVWKAENFDSFDYRSFVEGKMEMTDEAIIAYTEVLREVSNTDSYKEILQRSLNLTEKELLNIGFDVRIMHQETINLLKEAIIYQVRRSGFSVIENNGRRFVATKRPSIPIKDLTVMEKIRACGIFVIGAVILTIGFVAMFLIIFKSMIGG